MLSAGTLYFKICSRRPNNELSSARLVPIFFTPPYLPTPLLLSSLCFPSQKTANDKQQLYNGTRCGGMEHKKTIPNVWGTHTHTPTLTTDPVSIGSLNYSTVLEKRKRNPVFKMWKFHAWSPPPQTRTHTPLYIKYQTTIRRNIYHRLSARGSSVISPSIWIK